jgi:hypothetical protein
MVFSQNKASLAVAEEKNTSNSSRDDFEIQIHGPRNPLVKLYEISLFSKNIVPLTKSSSSEVFYNWMT